jgi:hypothetical protein
MSSLLTGSKQKGLGERKPHEASQREEELELAEGDLGRSLRIIECLRVAGRALRSALKDQAA